MPRRLKLEDLDKTERVGVRPRHLLALSGGGFRGLFTAEVLARMEAETEDRICKSFDLIAGTSIGGILAMGLACGFEAKNLRDKFEAHAPAIFRKRLTGAGGYFRSRYGQDGLRTAIESILGPWANRPFADLPVPICVVAIDEERAEPRIFRSEALAPGRSDATALIDVALATSAAPTYFPPHVIAQRTFIDGGLIANAPDLVAATEANRRWGARLSEVRVCSIGTAGSPRVGRATGEPGAAGWLAGRKLIELTIDAQSALAVDQLRNLGVDRYLRIDAVPRTPLHLDSASPEDAAALKAQAESAVAGIKTSQSGDWRLFLAHQPVREPAQRRRRRRPSSSQR